jgi:hypothetical protein
MEISPVPISRYTAAKAKVKCTAKATARVAKNVAISAAPIVLPFVAGAVAYRLSPGFADCVDWVRSELNICPRVSAAVTSGGTMGLFPDLFDQRFEQRQAHEKGLEVEEINFRRLVGKTATGAGTGLALSFLYDIQARLFPGKGFFITLKQVVLDQGPWTSLVYMPLYLLCVNAIMGKKENNTFKCIRENVNKLLPYNWGFWGPVLTIIYNLPQDLRVYAAQGFAAIWFFLLPKLVFASKAQTAAKTPGLSS